MTPFSALNPRANVVAASEAFGILTRHRELTFRMAQREVQDRYADQAYRLIWAIVHPLIVVLVYVFLFGYVFKAKILLHGAEMPLDYTVYMLAGFTPWWAFQEVLIKSPTALIAQANLVKQVIFPIEVLPVKGVLAACVNQMVLLTGVLLYVAVRFHTLPWTLVFLPVVLVLQVMAMVGAAFALAAIGTYFRSIREFVSMFCLINIYLMPVVYLPSWVPEPFQSFLVWNPFSHFIWCFQDLLFFGAIEHPSAFPITLLFSVGLFCVGYRLFRKFRMNFGSVL